jgi:hypothetical protein
VSLEAVVLVRGEPMVVLGVIVIVVVVRVKGRGLAGR